MAAPIRTLTLYRNILKELRSVYSQGKSKDSPAYQYVRKQFRDHNVTSEKLCRGKEEMAYLAQTYLCFLQSVKIHEGLNDKYQNGEERSIESAASLVGLKLPQTFDPDKKE